MLNKIVDHFWRNYHRFFEFFHRILGLNALRRYVGFWSALGLRSFVEPGWRAILKRHNYRDAYVTWASEAHRRVPENPGLILTLLQAQIAARQFVEARTTFDRLGPVLFASPKVTDAQFKAAQAVQGILEIEEGAFLERHVTLIGADSSIARHCYERAWEMHSMLLADRMKYFLDLYLGIENHMPVLVRHAAISLLRPNEMHTEIADLTRQTIEKWRKEVPEFYRQKLVTFWQSGHVAELLALRAPQDTDRSALDAEIDALNLVAVEAEYARSGKLPTANAFGSTETTAWNNALRYITAFEHFQNGEFAEAIGIIERNISAIRTQGVGQDDDRDKLIQKHYTLLAQIYERQRDFGSALLALRRAVELAKPVDWLDGPNWLLASALMHGGKWSEAGALMRRQLVGFWEQFAALSRLSIKARIRKGELVPRGNALILGGRGIGDEILRLVLLAGVRRPGQKYAFTVDPRLVPLLQPGNDWVEFLPVSRISGPYAVPESQYWRDREGVSARFDPNRVTAEVWRRVERGDQVILSEDIMVEALSRGPAFVPQAKPLVALADDERARVRAWLDTLPGKLKIGISWRSGDLNLVRNYSYKPLMEFGALLEIPGIDFINLQYTDTTEECAAARRAFGADIHAMPGVDLKDDLREICALALECDVVIAPCTTIREMAGAAGATVWSLTLTPFTPDLWRIMPDGKTDRYMPTMRHFSAMEFGNSDGVVLAMAEEARKLLQNSAASGRSRNKDHT